MIHGEGILPLKGRYTVQNFCLMHDGFIDKAKTYPIKSIVDFLVKNYDDLNKKGFIKEEIKLDIDEGNRDSTSFENEIYMITEERLKELLSMERDFYRLRNLEKLSRAGF